MFGRFRKRQLLVALGAALYLVDLAAKACGGEITQYFPADGPASQAETQWRVVWGIERHGGGSEVLFVREAYFKRSPSEGEIKVLGDCRIAEIFVPYNGGARIYDLSGHRFALVDLNSDDLGPSCVSLGLLFDRAGNRSSNGPVAAEFHDDHLRWMNASEQTRRGQVMNLWSVLDGANYRYIILYQFRDDGHIAFRLGATAHNLSSSDADSTTHLHMGCWRLHLELGDASRTRVSNVRQEAASFRTVADPIISEQRIEWIPQQFSRLRIESLIEMNGHNPSHPIGYELVPVRTGVGRYSGVGEEFTIHDLWITRARPMELRPRDLDGYENNEPIGEAPATLWHNAPVLHVARDEDFGINGTNAWQGVAITAWAGCDLKPRNFFAKTPLYP